MPDVQVFYPETIADAPLPQQVQGDFSAENPSSGGGTLLKPTVIKEQLLPTKKVAVELLSQALNSRSKKILQEFQFNQSGALQIGVFESGVSGDIRISPAGLVARDLAGNQTIAIDGDTGDAFFTGTLRSRSSITGDVIVGDNNIIIDGQNRRMIFYDESTGLPVIVIGNVG